MEFAVAVNGSSCRVGGDAGYAWLRVRISTPDPDPRMGLIPLGAGRD